MGNLSQRFRLPTSYMEDSMQTQARFRSVRLLGADGDDECAQAIQMSCLSYQMSVQVHHDVLATFSPNLQQDPRIAKGFHQRS